MAARKWFDLSINASGALKPDQPINPSVTYTANFATTDADLRVTLPEVESAKLSDWGQAYKTPLGIQLPAKLESSQGFSAGGQVTQTTSFSIPAAGIYRVHASARSEKVQADETTNRTQPATHAVVWLLVEETGGRILEDFDPDAVPDGFYRQPGPFREVSTGEPKPTQAGFSALVEPAVELIRKLFGAQSCGSGEVCISFVYYDMDLNGNRAIPGIYYEYEIVDGPDDYEDSGSGYADSEGTAEVSCPVYGARGDGTAIFRDSKARVVPLANSSFDFGHGDCGEELQYQLRSLESRTWVIAWHSIRDAEELFPSRSTVTIKVNPPRLPEEGCNFLTGEEAIRIVEDANWDCIWGGYGIFVFSHEYGHAVHDELLGDVAWFDQDICRNHAPNVVVDLGCAYNEGWADYFGMKTQTTVYANDIDPDPRFTETILEGNSYYRAGEDGSLDEGTVAAFFYDLLDAADEGHDSLSISAEDLYEVMDDCEVREGSEWVSPGGIDHLIWCLEADVDSSITGGDDYFPTRDPHPTQENQSNHAWVEGHVRLLWLKNLYGEGG